MVEEDLKAPGVQEWKEIVQERERWRGIVMTVKTVRVVNASEEEEEEEAVA